MRCNVTSILTKIFILPVTAHKPIPTTIVMSHVTPFLKILHLPISQVHHLNVKSHQKVSPGSAKQYFRSDETSLIFPVPLNGILLKITT